MSIIPCGARRGALPALILLFPFIVVLSVVVASPAFAGEWTGTSTVVDGVDHVMNPADAMEASLTVPLNERWRRGESDTEEVIFALLDDIAVADDGTIYVLDSQLNEVQVFAPNGEYIRSIGREGEGPGEFTFPRSVMVMPDGLIGVVQSMPGKIVQLTPEGDAAGNYPMPETDGMFGIQDAQVAGGHVFLHMRSTVFDNSSQSAQDSESIVRLAPDGKVDATMAHSERETDFTNLVFDEKKLQPISDWAGASDGTVYIAGSFDEYTIDVWNPQGRQVRTIEREFEPRVRTKEEREHRGPLIRISTGEGDLKTKVVRSETDRAVLEIFPRDDGSVWVLNPRGAYDTAKGELCVLDEFDAQGRFVRQLHLMGTGDLDKDAIEIRGNRVFVMTNRRSARYASVAQDAGDEDADASPMTLVCYEIPGGLSLK